MPKPIFSYTVIELIALGMFVGIALFWLLVCAGGIYTFCKYVL